MFRRSSGFHVFTAKANIYKSQPFNYSRSVFPYRPHLLDCHRRLSERTKRNPLCIQFNENVQNFCFGEFSVTQISSKLFLGVTSEMTQLKTIYCSLVMKTGLCFPEFSLHFKRFCTFVCGGREPLSLREGPLHFDASRAAITFSRPRYSRA